MSKRMNLFILIAWGISLALTTFLSFPQSALADDGNSNVCQIQPMAVDRTPTLQNIRLDTEGGSNITWDNSFKGLHRWSSGQWPGVDYLVNTTVAFKNGGVVSLIEWDDQGGGSSIYIDGIGPCKGWRQFFGHLNYNARDRFHEGQIVDANTVIGEPGCSGFEAACTTNGGYIKPHNHTTLGYWQNIFGFDDGTKVVSAGGYWWIHPSRLENATGTTNGDNPQSNEQPAETQNNESPAAENLPEGYSVIDNSTQKTFKPYFQTNILEDVIITFSPFRNAIIIALALVAILWVGGMIYSPQFRQSMAAFAVVAIVVTVFFIGVNQVSASSTAFSPPRNSNYVVQTSSDESWSVKSDNGSSSSEEDHQPPAYSGECSLSTSYPQSVLRWCDIIEKWAADRNMDPNWIAAVMLQESGGDPEILSGSGAVGLLQVMPRDGIAATFHNSQGVPYFSNRPSIEELKNPDFNIEYGSGMLLDLGINSDPREALLNYGPRPDDLERVYGSRYYYADLVISIYNNHK